MTIHLLSVPAAFAAGVHGWMVGSSRGQVWFPILLAVLAGLTVYPAVLRLFTAGRKFARGRLPERPARVTRSESPVPSAPLPAGPPAPAHPPSADDTGRVLVDAASRSR